MLSITPQPHDFPDLLRRFDYSRLVVLADENTHRHCYPLLLPYLPEQHDLIVVLAGETHKSLSTCEKVWQRMSELRLDRKALMLNLGGGVITDMGGFIAGTYKRGIPFLHLPTTLLGMVDAAIGGKVGIDLGSLKNQVGLFKLPEAIFICPAFLDTLPRRIWLSGFAEVIKHYLVADRAAWQHLQNQALETLDMYSLIEKAVQIKSAVVEQDMEERHIRKILNFGHTVGHAVESYFLDFDRPYLLHGEAVALGMIAEAQLSYQKGYLNETELTEISTYLSRHFSLPQIPTFAYPAIFEFMQQDKKNKLGQIQAVLLNKIGAAKWDETLDFEEFEQAMDFTNLKTSRQL